VLSLDVHVKHYNYKTFSWIDLMTIQRYSKKATDTLVKWADNTTWGCKILHWKHLCPSD